MTIELSVPTNLACSPPPNPCKATVEATANAAGPGAPMIALMVAVAQAGAEFEDAANQLLDAISNLGFPDTCQLKSVGEVVWTWPTLQIRDGKDKLGQVISICHVGFLATVQVTCEKGIGAPKKLGD